MRKKFQVQVECARTQCKRTKKSRNLAPSQAITEAAMADVAPAGVERRDKSTESPAKYAGNEDGEKSDEEHRGKSRWSGTRTIVC